MCEVSLGEAWAVRAVCECTSSRLERKHFCCLLPRQILMAVMRYEGKARCVRAHEVALAEVLLQLRVGLCEEQR